MGKHMGRLARKIIYVTACAGVIYETLAVAWTLSNEYVGHQATLIAWVGAGVTIAITIDLTAGVWPRNQ